MRHTWQVTHHPVPPHVGASVETPPWTAGPFTPVGSFTSPEPFTPPGPPAKPSPLPTTPVGYPQLLRGPRFRWWRPLLAIGLFAGFFVVLLAVFSVLLLVLQTLGLADANLLDDVTNPLGFGVLIGTLVVLIPISVLSIRIAFGTPVGYTASVAGRFRLRWAARCALVVLPIWGALMVVLYFSGQFDTPRPQTWFTLVIMVVLLIPFQAAGEEFFFRGFVMQVFGSWFRNRWLALIIPGIVSIPLFAAAHGSFNGWVFADLAVSATAWVYLTWRTGGLEAGVAVHAVNNCTLMITSLVLGGFEAGFVSRTTSGDPVSLLTSATTTGLAVLLITWQARRTGIQRWFSPKPPPAVASAGAGDGVHGEGPAQRAHGDVGQWPSQQPAGHRPVGQPEPGPGPRW